MKGTDLKINMPYQVHSVDRHFVGYFLGGNNVLTFRIGTDDKLILQACEIRKIVELSPRDIETRKSSGRFFIY